jgi:chaperonin cofactor prefoldin
MKMPSNEELEQRVKTLELQSERQHMKIDNLERRVDLLKETIQGLMNALTNKKEE